MKIAILGTGTVAQTLANVLSTLGYPLMLGTRQVSDTLHRKSFADWHQQNQSINIGNFEEAAAFGDCIINALQGHATLSVLKQIPKASLDHKVMIDIANPLDFSHGFPPCLIEGLHNTHSLGEAIQQLLPDTFVVKTLNTMWCGLMVNPQLINDGNHINYICGNDDSAKQRVLKLLNAFGWKNENILDLGDISNARGTESTLLLWTRIYAATKSGAFNMNIVK